MKCIAAILFVATDALSFDSEWKFNAVKSLEAAGVSEVYHSGLKLDDPLTKERTHDYLLFTSPRKVKRRTESLALLARVPTKFDVWPKDIEDYEFSLQTAANIVAPPTFTGELVKLDKGRAIDAMMAKHNLRPFLLDVYNVEYNYD